MAYTFNKFHWDEGIDPADFVAYLSTLFLLLTTLNDPLTGELVITPASGDNALKANQNVTLKAGKKLIFDGA